MKITSIDIQNQQFKVKFRGFDVREVDSFLEQVAESFEFLHAENNDLHGKLHKAELENDGFKKREDMFKHVLLNSQKVLDQIKDSAQKKSELVLAEAEIKAEKILHKAHNRLSQLYEDIAELKRQRMQIEVQLRSTLETHTKLLDMSKEEVEIHDEADDKIKLLS